MKHPPKYLYRLWALLRENECFPDKFHNQATLQFLRQPPAQTIGQKRKLRYYYCY